MSKVIYKREESLIPNSQLESMFLSIATDEQMQNYTTLIEKGQIHTATAYASHRVKKIFMYFRDEYIRQGGELDWLAWKLYKDTK